MTELDPTAQVSLRSRAEELVYQGMLLLPSAYSVELNKRIDLSSDGNVSGRKRTFYEADFVVVSNGAVNLYVEVKTDASLSIGNVLRFREIEALIKSRREKFLLLVVSDFFGGSNYPSIEIDVKGVTLKVVEKPSDVVQFVLEQLSSRSPN